MYREYAARRALDGEYISVFETRHDKDEYRRLAETLSKVDPKGRWELVTREVSPWAVHDEPAEGLGQVQMWLNEDRLSGFVHRVSMFRDFQEWVGDDAYNTFKRNTFYNHLYELLGEPSRIKGELGWLLDEEQVRT
jgi:hypothetical protein